MLHKGNNAAISTKCNKGTFWKTQRAEHTSLIGGRGTDGRGGAANLEVT